MTDARIEITVTPEEYQELARAARLAERSVVDFVVEEALSLARLINTHGNLTTATLARHRQETFAAFQDAFDQAGKEDTAIRDWADRQGQGVGRSGPSKGDR